jgi:predicted PurR-regulated permease PerM|uniref:AI-2E family transporter n=1 Tax=candidate division WOR-3 bacterium TaxID=2052148 RepID=A0A7C6AF11_UNCW3
MERILPYFAIAILLIFVLVSRVFTPVWLLVLAIFILWQYRRTKEIRPVFFATLFLLGGYVIIYYFSILIPFIIGTGIAYIVAPLIDRLEQKKIPRALAILVVILPLIALVPFIIFLLVINLIGEIKILIEKIPELVDQSKVFFSGIIQRLAAVGIILNQEIVLNAINNYFGTLLNGLLQTILQIGQGVKGIIFLLYNFILTPIISYILLADREKIAEWVKNLLPEEEHQGFNSFIKKLNVSFSRYFRGQFILMIVVGFIIGFMLWLLGIRYYVFLGIVAGLCNLIPNVGFVLGLVIAIFVGLFTPPAMITIIKILAVYLGEQLLENLFLGPVIIGKAARLNPAIVMLALILGGTIAGFWGLILAVPVVIFIREFLNHFFGLRL